MKAIVLSGDDSGKELNYRPLTVDEVKRLQPGTRVKVFTGYFGRNRLGGLVNVKVNGKPKTWKTRVDDVSVPVKYGLYECTTIDYRNGVMSDSNIYFVSVDK